MADMPPGLRKKYEAQQVAGKNLAKPAKAISVAAPSEKNSKYHNMKVVVNGIRFDSRKEARRYQQLMDALREGAIFDLRLQHDFTLIEGYTKYNGERVQAEKYRADFTYRVCWPWNSVPTSVSIEDLEYWQRIAATNGSGYMIIEDVKSRATRTQVYINKYKMMADKGYTIREV